MVHAWINYIDTWEILEGTREVTLSSNFSERHSPLNLVSPRK